MTLDPDAAEILALLRAGGVAAGLGTDARLYRKTLAQRFAPSVTVPVDHVLDLEMGGGGAPLPARIYRHRDVPGARPAIVFLHGGGFVSGSLESHDGLCRRLAIVTGWAVLSVDYRLAPEHPFPAALDDARRALDWAVSNEAVRYGIDRARIAVGGDSAGGAIAAALALATRDCGGPAIVHQLLLYPVLDNRCDTESYRENGQDYLLTEAAMRWFWAQYAPGERAVERYAAPARAKDLAGLPSATIISAGHDPLRDEAADYAARLHLAGVDVDYRCFPGVFHGFLLIDRLSASAAALDHVALRLRRACGWPSSPRA